MSRYEFDPVTHEPFPQEPPYDRRAPHAHREPTAQRLQAETRRMYTDPPLAREVGRSRMELSEE